MHSITARLEDWLAERIRQFWAERGEGPSSGMRRVAGEWWTREHLPLLEFRDAVHALDVGLGGVGDARVFEYARERGRILVTRNYADFAALVEAHIRRRTAFPGVLFVPSSLRQNDVGGHVTAVEGWIETHRGQPGALVETYGWL